MPIFLCSFFSLIPESHAHMYCPPLKRLYVGKTSYIRNHCKPRAHDLTSHTRKRLQAQSRFGYTFMVSYARIIYH